MCDSRIKRDKNQNIKVFVRVRPINNAETASKSPVIVEIPSNDEIEIHDKNQVKKFRFDKVFGPNSKQVDVYNDVVKPLVGEILAGFNCTVFAYGQTGTGKTFTMEGSCYDATVSWQADFQAGVIPRALSHLFDELQSVQTQEYHVRVSFLELYNEEIFDLLSSDDDTSKIKIYDDPSKKGAILMDKKLEEVIVKDRTEVYKILERGSKKRQTAATLLNAHSSRSHTIFSITVFLKENGVDGEELLKMGKLNLVDLAGSENVGKSGAVDKRAREAGKINRSLLTLGKVIIALVEKAPHIPYRESKLTRLLQESLGGRTKTSIIATVSPAGNNIEETVSTLEYAHRAKNIMNRPEMNDKLSKKTLIKEYLEEIEKLQRDLIATRERNGVYVAPEAYAEMQSLIEIQTKELEEKIDLIKLSEETIHMKEKSIMELKCELDITSIELCEMKTKLESLKNTLNITKSQLKKVTYDRNLQKHLVNKHLATEEALINQGRDLINVAETATTDTKKLHEKISRKQQIEEENLNLTQQFKQDMSNYFVHLEENLDTFVQKMVNSCSSLKSQIVSETETQIKAIHTTIEDFSKDVQDHDAEVTKKFIESVKNSHEDWNSWSQKQLEKASNMTEHEFQALENISSNLSPKICELIENNEKVSANLKVVNDHAASKLMNLVNFTKQSVDGFCNTLLTNQDQFRRKIEEMKKTLEITIENYNQMLENEQSSSELLVKLKSQFLDTFQKYESLETEKKKLHSLVLKGFDHLDTHGKQINEYSQAKSEENMYDMKCMGEEIEQTIECVQKEVLSTTSQALDSLNDMNQKTLHIPNLLENDVTSSRNILQSYHNQFKSEIECLQNVVEKQKEEIQSTARASNEIVSTSAGTFSQAMGEHYTAIRGRSNDLSCEVEQLSSGSVEWKSNFMTQTQSMQKTVKSLGENMKRDISTGDTPCRREFNFPRVLVTTSPHERIVKRFRENRKKSDSSNTEYGDSAVDVSFIAVNSVGASPLPRSMQNDEFMYCQPLLKSPVVIPNDPYTVEPISNLEAPTRTEVITEKNNKENPKGFVSRTKKFQPKGPAKPKSVKKILSTCN
ncbi:hypothetical protein QAD02_005552 [Eretmocerus hayati]|uniref:Uncharacterized protein n=1 Tax=Eretmocerus hayati TaxID=131215 RepID=A0ACC2NSM0_9HYME|nr:hypothetical protein QAD02_005552 [Eretmocerus hayati]